MIKIRDLDFSALDDWRGETNGSVSVTIAAHGIAIHLQTACPYAVGRAAGALDEAPAVIAKALADYHRSSTRDRIEAEVRAEVERRMLEQASTTERSSTDSERDARGAAE